MKSIIAVLLLCGVTGAQTPKCKTCGSDKYNPAAIPMVCYAYEGSERDLHTPWNCEPMNPLPEPMDTEAIESETTEWIMCFYQDSGCVLHGFGSDAVGLARQEKVKHYSCAGKTRILEHDEQDPPKWWCRKVQP